jgi:hypothetical protein
VPNAGNNSESITKLRDHCWYYNEYKRSLGEHNEGTRTPSKGQLGELNEGKGPTGSIRKVRGH